MDESSAAYVGIARLHAKYADVASRMAWTEMGDIVLPDARLSFDFGEGHVLELTGPDEVGSFGAKATASFAFYSYQPLNSVLTHVEASTASGRFYALEVAVERDTGNWLEFYGAYDDEYERRGDSWMFSRRAFRTLARRPNPA